MAEENYFLKFVNLKFVPLPADVKIAKCDKLRKDHYICRIYQGFSLFLWFLDLSHNGVFCCFCFWPVLDLIQSHTVVTYLDLICAKYKSIQQFDKKGYVRGINLANGYTFYEENHTRNLRKNCEISQFAHLLAGKEVNLTQ